MSVRVRFAPSPTGYMHVGNVRTALFNWLFARNKGGIFILRIEDTDIKRNIEEAVSVITEGLSWLGLDWDEGPGTDGEFSPYYQSRRLQLYREHAEMLIEQDAAYICLCEQREDEGQECRCGEVYAGENLREGAAVRLRNPSDTTVFSDIVQGELSFENEQFGDFVLLKSDGTPTYNFANVVDDQAMEITHVIRGDDHVSNTPRQLMLYGLFGYDPPIFAHLPQILGPDGARLSKRHGAASLTEYRDQGFLPEAMMNYLALLGWAPEGEQEFMTPDELVRSFRLERVRQSPGQFNMERLVHLNSLHMKPLSARERAELAAESLLRSGLLEEVDASCLQKIEEIVSALGSRFKYGEQVVEYGGHFFRQDVSIPEDLHPYITPGDVREALDLAAGGLDELAEWSDDSIEEVVRSTASQCGLKAAPLIHGIRVALSGKTVGPSLFTLVRLVGQERSSYRIRQALEKIPGEA